MVLKSNDQICSKCLDARQIWDGEEYVECECNYFDSIDSIIEVSEEDMFNDDFIEGRIGSEELDENFD